VGPNDASWLGNQAIVFRDPDGYPVVFFLSSLSGEAYVERFPATPFVYGQYMRVPVTAADKADHEYELDRARIKIEAAVAFTEDLRRATETWLSKDSLETHLTYYRDTLGTKLLTKTEVSGGEEQFAFEWDRHFMCMRTKWNHAGGVAENSTHNMGGNKGVVPLPHFGVNTDFLNFEQIRDKIDDAMAAAAALGLVNASGAFCTTAASILSEVGHMMPCNFLDSFDMLFPTDADSCLSIFAADPSGNTNEVKWYIDLGEMFHTSGEKGVETSAGGDRTLMNGVVIDNSMVVDHFPPAVLQMMERRAAAGESVGEQVAREVAHALEQEGKVVSAA
jgi:extradiol dioxygenase family protein